MRIAIVAGEASGDLLGRRLIESLITYYPDAVFEGIAGHEMQRAGCESLYAMDRLSVMGFSEVATRLFELLKLRKNLIKRWLNDPPDLFIGIDAPDFNLKLEKTLYEAGITTVHYVSPSVWAWRANRVKKMLASMDLMLTLFPFEAAFYKKHNIPAEFTGHPLADEIPLEAKKADARKSLGLPSNNFILAVLPGSRMGEINRLTGDFLEAIKKLQQQHPDWRFVAPLISEKVKKRFDEIKQEIAPEVDIIYVDSQSRMVMQAADQILMASGTAVLEGMLIGRPMVAAYRVANVTYAIIRSFNMIKSKYFTLPNILADEYLVPELIQRELTPQSIIVAVENQYTQPANETEHMLKRFKEIHLQLRMGANEKAAAAIHGLLSENHVK